MSSGVERNDIAGRIIVALDYPDTESARSLLRALKDIPCWMKVGMELFYAAGSDFVRELKDSGYRVFVDLKMHDIPNTVRGGAFSLSKHGADMFNVHAAGGKDMMRAAMEGAAEAAAAARSGGADGGPIVIAVTQLTSTSQQVLNAEIGIPGSVENAVLAYAKLAHESGLHGVVASPLEASAIKSEVGGSFVTVTPGIRPAGAALGDQSRVTTPAEALNGGSDYIVIGRPITKEPSPREALLSIIESCM